jgi:hypothetical protein
MKINLDIVKDVTYKYANFYYKILPPIRNNCRQFCTSLIQSLY